jgi:hypothetical protein
MKRETFCTHLGYNTVVDCENGCEKRFKTLEELIIECGYGLRSLSFHTDGRWIAKSGGSVLPKSKLFTGKNPREAIEKLLLALTPSHKDKKKV